MNKRDIPVSITISKPHGNRDGQVICVRLRDKVSGIQFTEAQFSLHDFMDALTGMAEVAGSCEVRGLEYVGMERITEPRIITCPMKGGEGESFEQWLIDNAQEDGWLLNTYLGSQGSRSSSAGGTVLRYSVSKFVPKA